MVVLWLSILGVLMLLYRRLNSVCARLHLLSIRVLRLMLHGLNILLCILLASGSILSGLKCLLILLVLKSLRVLFRGVRSTAGCLVILLLLQIQKDDSKRTSKSKQITITVSDQACSLEWKISNDSFYLKNMSFEY